MPFKVQWRRYRVPVWPLLFVMCLASTGILYYSLATEGNLCRCSKYSTFSDQKLFQDHTAGHFLAVIVPLRNRFEELQEFVVHMTNFLNSQNVKHHIFAINQVDDLRFNRASLLNAGFKELDQRFDYIALHDVDLLPLHSSLLYSFPEDGPLHLAAPHLHPRYHYPTFIGGVLLLTREQFERVNGLSNVYWGWGLEDDELYARLKEAGYSIQRPGQLSLGQNSFKHVHNKLRRTRDEIRCFDQHLLTRRRDRKTGLSSAKYDVKSLRQLIVDGAPVTVLNVELQCSYTDTPWCNCSHSVANSDRVKAKLLMRQVPPGDIIAPKLDRNKHISFDQ